MSIFEKASRLALRFESPKGSLSTEDLWNLPLTSTVGKANLDDIAKALHREIKNGDNISFVDPSRGNNDIVQLRFDIVKHVIDTKLRENKERAEHANLMAQKQKIMEFITEKQEIGLRGKTEQELLEELDKISKRLEPDSEAA